MAKLTRRSALKTAATFPLVGTAMAASKQKPYLILSCDGGGIRGLITAKIIERLEKEVPFLDQVELYAGTSTGGIIALGLADKKTPTELVKLYRTRGKDIFTNARPILPKKDERFAILKDSLLNLQKEFFDAIKVNPNDLFHPKYPNEGLSQVLTDTFSDRPLSNLRAGSRPSWRR